MKTFLVVIVGSVLLLNTLSRINACGGRRGRRCHRVSGVVDGCGTPHKSETGEISARNRRETEYTGSDGERTYVGKTGIRDSDETGYRTGLGHLGKSVIKDPKGTLKVAKVFVDYYRDMKKANVVGENIRPHEKANEVEATKAAAAISAAREQYKRFREKQNLLDAAFHTGDTRTDKEIMDTTDAKKRGREKVKAEKSGKSSR